MSEPKSCGECGSEFQRRANQSAARFEKQRFCSKACANYVDPDCRICNGPHVLAEHRRTLRLRAWFRGELMRKIQDPDDPAPAKAARPGFGRSPIRMDVSERGDYDSAAE